MLAGRKETERYQAVLNNACSSTGLNCSQLVPFTHLDFFGLRRSTCSLRIPFPLLGFGSADPIDCQSDARGGVLRSRVQHCGWRQLLVPALSGTAVSPCGEKGHVGTFPFD